MYMICFLYYKRIFQKYVLQRSTVPTGETQYKALDTLIDCSLIFLDEAISEKP